MGGISGFSPNDGGKLKIQGYAGLVLKNGEQLITTSFVLVPPLYGHNTDGVGGPITLYAKSAWFPSAGPFEMDGQVTTEVPIGVKGANDFIWDGAVVSEASIAPDVAFRFEAWTKPGGVGTNIIPARGLTLPTTRDIVDIPFTPFRMKPDSFYPRVTVANSVPLTFSIAFYGRVWRGKYT